LAFLNAGLLDAWGVSLLPAFKNLYMIVIWLYASNFQSILKRRQAHFIRD